MMPSAKSVWVVLVGSSYFGNGKTERSMGWLATDWQQPISYQRLPFEYMDP
jgi:hypothetical protein